MSKLKAWALTGIGSFLQTRQGTKSALALQRAHLAASSVAAPNLLCGDMKMIKLLNKHSNNDNNSNNKSNNTHNHNHHRHQHQQHQHRRQQNQPGPTPAPGGGGGGGGATINHNSLIIPSSPQDGPGNVSGLAVAQTRTSVKALGKSIGDAT